MEKGQCLWIFTRNLILNVPCVMHIHTKNQGTTSKKGAHGTMPVFEITKNSKFHIFAGPPQPKMVHKIPETWPINREFQF